MIKKIIGERKYIEVVYTDETQEKLRNYCKENGLDINVSYYGNYRSDEDVDFHTTIIYSTSRHNLKNQSIEEPIKHEVYPYGFDLFDYVGKEGKVASRVIPVLKVEGSTLLSIFHYYNSKHNFKMSFPFNPHITLSYGHYDESIFKEMPLPDFPLEFDRINIKTAK